MSDIKKRRDLATLLQDKEARKAYLHPKKAGFFRVLHRMYAPVRKSPRMIAASFFYALTNGALPLLSVLVIYILVGLLSAPGAGTNTMLLAAGIYALLYFVCGMASQQLNHRNYTWFTRSGCGYLTLSITS